MTTLVAGHELDALVGEKVMGLTRSVVERLARKAFLSNVQQYIGRGCVGDETWEDDALPEKQKFWRQIQIPQYSTDIAAAWKVVEHLTDAEYGVVLSNVRAADTWTCEIDRSEWAGSEVEDGATAPLAICLAALKAVEK